MANIERLYMKTLELILGFEIWIFLIATIVYFRFSGEIGTYIAINIDSFYFMSEQEIATLFKESKVDFNGFDLMVLTIPRTLAVILGWVLVVGAIVYIFDFIKYLDKKIKNKCPTTNIQCCKKVKNSEMNINLKSSNNEIK